MGDMMIVINLTLAFLFGGIIGFLREAEGKTAGLRTHILVCVGSALLMMLSSYMLTLSSLADPGRIAAGVVTGIGFLGAGTIIVTGRNRVKGLTTAAGLWATACIGLAIGIGILYILSGMAFLSSASTGIVSTASTLSTVLPIVGVIAAFTVAGLLYTTG